MSFYGYIELQRCTAITDSALAVMAVTVQCQCSASAVQPFLCTVPDPGLTLGLFKTVEYLSTVEYFQRLNIFVRITSGCTLRETDRNC